MNKELWFEFVAAMNKEYRKLGKMADALGYSVTDYGLPDAMLGIVVKFFGKENDDDFFDRLLGVCFFGDNAEDFWNEYFA